jgi:hypothetical protein
MGAALQGTTGTGTGSTSTQAIANAHGNLSTRFHKKAAEVIANIGARNTAYEQNHGPE